MLDVFMRLMTEAYFIAANIQPETKKKTPYTYHSVAAWQRGSVVACQWDRAWNQYWARLNFSVFGRYTDVIMYFLFICVLLHHIWLLLAPLTQLLKLKFSLPPKVRLKSPFYIHIFNIQAWDEMKMSLSWRPWRDEQWRVALSRNIYSSASNSDAPSPSPQPLHPSRQPLVAGNQQKIKEKKTCLCLWHKSGTN